MPLRRAAPSSGAPAGNSQPGLCSLAGEVGEDILCGDGHELSLGLDIHVLRAASVDRGADLAAFADRAGAESEGVKHGGFIGTDLGFLNRSIGSTV